MGLDVYLRRDIANVLRAVASVDEAADREGAQCLATIKYHTGFRDALIAVGLACGLHQMVSKEHRDGAEWIEMDRGAGQ